MLGFVLQLGMVVVLGCVVLLVVFVVDRYRVRRELKVVCRLVRGSYQGYRAVW